MQRAVVLLSGGLDSATVLAIARSDGFHCHCLTIDYGQRHRAELQAAARVARQLDASAHRVIRIDLNRSLEEVNGFLESFRIAFVPEVAAL